MFNPAHLVSRGSAVNRRHENAALEGAQAVHEPGSSNHSKGILDARCGIYQQKNGEYINHSIRCGIYQQKMENDVMIQP